MADTNADGSVAIEINLDVGDVDKQLARLKRNIQKMQTDLEVKKGTQSALEKDLDVIEGKLIAVQKRIEAGSKSEYDLDDFTNLKAEATALEKKMNGLNKSIQSMTYDLQGSLTAYANLSKQAQQAAAETENISKAAAELEDTIEISDEVKGNNTLGDAVASELDNALGPMDDAAVEIGQRFIAYLRAVFTHSGDMQEAGSILVQRLRQATLGETETAREAGQEVGQAVADGAEQGVEQAVTAADRFRQAWADMPTVSGAVISAFTGIRDALVTAGTAISTVVTHPLQTLDRLLAGIVTTVGNAASAMLQFGQTLLGKVASGLKSIVSYAGKAATSLLKVGNSTGNTSVNFKQGLTTMLKYGFGIRSLYSLFNKLRTSLTEAYEDLASYDSTVNASISSVKSSLSTLKNSLATAFAPIVNVVAPILTSFINMLADAITYVGMFFASLTGATSYTKAIGVQEDYADSLSDTADAANSAAEAVQNLSGLDEINTWDSGSSGSGGSGSSGSGSSASDLFETVEIEPWSFDSWGEAFSTFLGYLLDEGVPALESALSVISDTVNEFSANVLEMFTFPGVQDKVAQLGVEVAEALNTFVDDIDWNTLGRAIGAGLNTAINFAVNFLSTFDFVGLGDSLATLINGAIDEINWNDLGKLLWEGFTTGWEIFVGFITVIDVSAIKQAGIDAIDGFIGGLNDTLENTDWSEIGSQLSGLVTAFLEWAQHAADTVEWEELGQAIADLALSIDWVDIATRIVDLMADIIGGLGTAVVTALEDIGPAFLNWAGETASKILQTFQALFNNLASIFKDGVSPAEAWENFKIEVSAIWADDEETQEIHSIFTKGPEVTTFSIEADAETSTNFAEFNEDWQEIVKDPYAYATVGAETGEIEEEAGDIIEAIQDSNHSPTSLSAKVDVENGELDPEAAAAVLGEGKSVDTVVNLKSGTTDSNAVVGLSATNKAVTTTANAKTGTMPTEAKNVLLADSKTVTTTATVKKGSTWIAEGYKALNASSKTVTTTAKVAASGFNTNTAAYKALIASTHTVTVNAKLGTTIALKKLVTGSATLKIAANGQTISGATMSVAARGGIINAATLFGGFGHTLLAGEAGKEAIVPLERHTEWADVVAAQMAGKLAQTRGQTSLSGLFNGLRDSITSVFKGPFDGISTALNRIGTVVKVPSVVTRPISMPPIPALAQGAVIPSNREFLAVLGDQKNGQNLEAPESLIRQIMREELANNKSGGNTYDVNITARGSSFLEFILTEGKARQTRTGKNPFELT